MSLSRYVFCFVLWLVPEWTGMVSNVIVSPRATWSLGGVSHQEVNPSPIIPHAFSRQRHCHTSFYWTPQSTISMMQCNPTNVARYYSDVHLEKKRIRDRCLLMENSCTQHHFRSLWRVDQNLFLFLSSVNPGLANICCPPYLKSWTVISGE